MANIAGKVKKWQNTAVTVTAEQLSGWMGRPPGAGRDNPDGYLKGDCPACGHPTVEPLPAELTFVRFADVSMGSNYIVVDRERADHEAIKRTPGDPRVDVPEILMVDRQRSLAVAVAADTESLTGCVDYLRHESGRAPAHAEPQDEYVDLVHCRCHRSHEGRDDEKDRFLGCGRYWAASLVIAGPGDGWAVRPSDPAVWADALVLDDLEQAEAADVKASADAWATTMATLLGILGVSGLLLSRDTVVKLEVLPRAVVFAALLVAAAFAWMAHLGARTAASGVPVSIQNSGRSGQRRSVVTRVGRAAEDQAESLRNAKRCAAASAVAVAIGIGALWFAAPVASPTLVNIGPDQVCGELVDSNGPATVSVKRGDGHQPTPVHVDANTTIDVVDVCP